eukprot:SAG31_NODE_4596_length_3105_cov_4.885562_3_plen_148_part_00
MRGRTPDYMYYSVTASPYTTCKFSITERVCGLMPDDACGTIYHRGCPPISRIYEFDKFSTCAIAAAADAAGRAMGIRRVMFSIPSYYVSYAHTARTLGMPIGMGIITIYERQTPVQQVKVQRVTPVLPPREGRRRRGTGTAVLNLVL